MDLLLVTGGFPKRSETFIYRKTIGLARRGHRVTMATRSIGDWSLYPDPFPSSIRVMELLPDYSLRLPHRAIPALAGAMGLAARDLRGAMEVRAQCLRDPRTKDDPARQFLRHLPFSQLRPRVVHFEFLSLGAMYPLAREILRAPMVVSCRGNDLHTLELRPERERNAMLECLRTADAVHAVSQEMANEVARVSGRKTGVWVNRPAVEVERIQPRSHDGTRGPLRILATGRLVWKKGFDYLLAALQRLAQRGVAFRAEILGDGELRPQLRYSIVDLGLEPYVTLGGAVSSAEVLQRLQDTDVFVLSSVEEGISNAVLEAMASAVPIVTTTAGGMAEAVTDGIEGFVVGVRDVAALADRIEQLAGDPDRRIAMGLAARARAERDFTLARQLSVFEDIYASIGDPR